MRIQRFLGDERSRAASGRKRVKSIVQTFFALGNNYKKIEVFGFVANLAGFWKQIMSFIGGKNSFIVLGPGRGGY